MAQDLVYMELYLAVGVTQWRQIVEGFSLQVKDLLLCHKGIIIKSFE